MAGKGLIKNCKFVQVRVCDHPGNMMYVALASISLLPFFYLPVKLIRDSRFQFNRQLIPTVFYCFVMCVSNIHYIIYNFTFSFIYHGTSINLNRKLLYMPMELELLSIIAYFKSIIEILQVFSVRHSNILFYIAIMIQFLCTFLFLFRIITSFIDLPSKFNNFIEQFQNQYYLYALIFEKGFLSFCFLILSICFIFSNIKNYLPVKTRIPMKVALFLYPLTVFIYYTSNVIIYEKIFQYWGRKQFNLQYYTYCFLCYLVKFSNTFIILWIIWMLTIREFNHQDSSTNMEEIMQTMELI